MVVEPQIIHNCVQSQTRGEPKKAPQIHLHTMDKSFNRSLRILTILAILAITGFEMISKNPQIWWAYLIFATIILAILLLIERRRPT